MRVLLDEQLDRRLKPLFDADFYVRTVEEQGWKGTKNGELLRLAQTAFDVFVTMDKSIEYQHNLSLIRLGIVFISARTNRYQDVAPLIPEVNQVLRVLQVGQIARVFG
jgi:predicted nuclease of predicted toxin-antitoxin system